MTYITYSSYITYITYKTYVTYITYMCRGTYVPTYDLHTNIFASRTHTQTYIHTHIHNIHNIHKIHYIHNIHNIHDINAAFHSHRVFTNYGSRPISPESVVRGQFHLR